MKLANGMMLALKESNDIAVLQDGCTVAEPPSVGFSTSKEFTHIISTMPMSRVVDIWNKLAPRVGLKPLSKFENRQIATVRIWGAIQKLEPAAAPATVPPVPPVAATVEAAAPEVVPVANAAAVPQPEPGVFEAYGPEADKPAKQARAPRNDTAKHQVIEMLQRDGGVTLAEIMAATGWQAHTCRAFVSTVPKKLGIEISSTKREDGARVYAVAK